MTTFVHANGQTGVLPAAIGSTDSSINLGRAWAGASGIAKLIVDPALAGIPNPNMEITYATVSNGSATATGVQRGQEGTAAAPHAQSAIWVCGPTGLDIDSLATNPMTTLGDVIVGAAGGTPARLGLGTNGQFLGVSGGVIGYFTPFTNPMTSVGDIIVGGASGTPTRLAQGANGTFFGVSGGVVGYYTVTGVAWPLTNSADETFQPNSIANNTLTLHNNASAVNGLQMVGTATTVAPILQAVGSDANIGVTIFNKGNGDVQLQLGTSLYIFAGSGAGSLTMPGGSVINRNPGFRLTSNSVIDFIPQGQTSNASLQVTGPGGSAANGINIVGSNTTPSVQALQHSGAAVDLSLQGGGLPSNITLGSTLNSTLGQVALSVSNVTSGVNGVTASQAVTTAAPSLAATGSDTNIDLTLGAKGSGLINFGYAVTALGGGAAPTLGTIGGSGPATAAQNAWLAVKINGTTSFLPVWR